MITVEFDDTRAHLWLSALPAKLRAALEKEISTLAQDLRTHIIRDKLVGQVLNRRSGRLGQSIQERVESSTTAVTGVVYSSGDVPYARIHEYGGKTAAHVIKAKNADALAFMWRGKQAFYKKVNHPGSNMPERSYMRSSLKDMKDEITERLQRAVTEGSQP